MDATKMTVVHMSCDELAELEDDLGDILRGRALEEKRGLVGLDTEALRLMRETVGEALDRYAEAESAYERREYERSV